MTLSVHLFARVRESAGTDTVVVTLADGANVEALRRSLAAHLPTAADLIARSAVGINGEYASDDCVVGPADEIALIPPVSGG